MADDPVAEHGPAVVDRAAAFAAGPPRFPRRAIAIALTCLAGLGLGGAAVDHFFPGPVGAAVTTTTSGDYPPALSPVPAPGPSTRSSSPAPSGPPPASLAPGPLPAPAPALMALENLKANPAPGFSLLNQHGHPASLRALRGRVVVLSFFDATCDDICAVLEGELAQADRELGPDRARVSLVSVNTDPLAATVASAHRAALGPLGRVAGWQFLTGPVAQLDSIWTDYGLSIEVERTTHTVSHNDLLYFIDPLGRLRLRATPFADENASGVFSLPSATRAQWARGIAADVKSLLGPPA